MELPGHCKHFDSVMPAIPLKRVGNPDEIAGLCMTGSSMTIDCGDGSLSAQRIRICAPRTGQ